MLYFFFVQGWGDTPPWIADVNIFRYITFRVGGAIMTALFICFMLGGRFIDYMRLRQGKGQPIRDDGPEGHLVKRGTPTMGGVMILGASIFSTLLWARLDNAFVWIVLLVTISFGLIGFADDLAKVRKYTTAGISGRLRLLLGFVIAAVATHFVTMNSPSELQNAIAVPVFKDVLINLDYRIPLPFTDASLHFAPLFLLFGFVVIVGAANAVNLTDGLDGLAIVPVMIAAGCFGAISYFVGNYTFSNYLQLHWVPGTGEIAVVCGALIGSGLGFLWYNAPPAMVFMGDTGSLALGGALGAAAVATKHEIVLAIIGGLFVVETLSVMIQVGYFKATGKRVFLMAPIHHHFERKGWREPTIVIRFWIISVILALIGLATLKLR